MKNTKLILIVFCINFIPNYILFAQNKKSFDSALAVAYKPQPDTNSLTAFSFIQRTFFNKGQYDSSFKYAKAALLLAKQLKNINKLSQAQYNLGLVCTNLTKYDSAIFYLTAAKQSALQLNDSFLLASCYNAFSILYNYQSDYSTSLDYGIKAASVLEHSTNPILINLLPKIYHSIAGAFYAENQFEKSMEYNKKILKFHNYPDEIRYRIITNLDIADAYIKLKQFDFAKPYLDSALILDKTFDNIVLKTLVANTEGNYYDNVGDYTKSLTAYLHSYSYSKDSCKNDYLVAEAADNVGNIYFKLNNFSETLKYAMEANSIALQKNHFRVAASTYNLMKNVAVQNGDYKTALKYAILNKDYTDSAINEATQKTTLSLESKYQSQKKEKEIADLKVINTQKELAAVKRNRFLIVGSVSAASIMLLLGFMYRNSNNKKIIAQKEQRLQSEQIKFLEGQQQLISLQSMVNGQEAERTRIAKDLHDGLGGLFSTVKMYFSTLEHEQEQLKEDILFKKSYELIDTASEEIRRIAHNMMPEVLMKLGLVPALQDVCSNISAGKLLQVKLQQYGMEKRLNISTEIMLYRIVQELLNNIIKHAKATEAIVQFNRNADKLTVTVEDNGMGFNLMDVDAKNHAGLDTIRSRVSYLNGNISIESQQQIGTTIMMEFLIQEEVAKI